MEAPIHSFRVVIAICMPFFTAAPRNFDTSPGVADQCDDSKNPDQLYGHYRRLCLPLRRVQGPECS